MADRRDYTRQCRIASAALVVLLAAVALIPPQKVGGVRLRRANILSDIVRFDDAASPETAADASLPLDEEEYAVDLEEVARQVAQPRPHTVETRYLWEAASVADTLSERIYPAPASRPAAPIEDFDTTGSSRMEALYRKWLVYGIPVRIAFMGDSFIEGDILTADLRERLQDAFGGRGPGFAPAASPHTGFRRTVKTRSKGWSTYNIMQRRSAPQPLAGSFTVTGWVCRPASGATTRWECTDARRHLDTCTAADLLFLSRSDSRVEVTMDDSRSRTFEIEGGEALRRITVRGPFRSLGMKVLSGADGFVGYGARLRGTQGVVVDNFSVRSNNGQAMFWTDPSLNAQMDALAGGYDLVVLQYGLNIMQPGIRNFAKYGEQIEKMVAYVRRCFPEAAVLVLGVSDRSMRSEEGGGFVPMDSAPYMIECQRQAARRAGAAFWSTYDAMRAMGGMDRFVENGWAGKDYTHINYAGGREVAHALYDALYDEVYRLQQKELLRKRRLEELRKVLSDELPKRLLQDSVVMRPEPR